MPAVPLHTAVSYVAGAYLVFFALILVYVAIMATKLSRIETELSELTDLVIDKQAARDGEPSVEPPSPVGPPSPVEPPNPVEAQAEAPDPDAPKTTAAAR